MASNAQADEGRAVVIVVEGGDGEAVAAGIASHIEAPYTVRDPKAFRAALGARLGPAVGSRARDAQLIARAHAAATDAHVDAVILVSIRKGRRGPLAHVWAVDAHAEGAAVDKDVSLAAAAGASDEADATWAAAAGVVPPIKDAAPAEPAATAPTPSAPPAPLHAAEPPGPGGASDPARDSGPASPPETRENEHPRAHALLIVQAGVDAGSRHYSYVDRLTPQLRPYDLFAAPLASITAQVYPFARTSLAVLNGLGVTGDYARAFGLASADAGGTRVGTTWQDFDVGLRERIRMGHSLLMGINLGYGAVDFHFDSSPGSTAVLPSVSYRFLRAGLDLQIAFGAISVVFGGAYLPVLSTGSVGDLFPRENAGGAEARLGVAHLIGQSFEVSLGISYTRFFYSFNPVPGDANVAGGALDEMARLSLGLAYLL
jgi:hypothetical protein